MLRFCVLLITLGCALALWAAELPVTEVVLFSSGVGYVQRTGTVKGTATVQLTFKPAQVNDLLKSLVLLDMDGGQVGAVTYGAKDPLVKTLQAFAVNLTDNPTLGQLLDRLRGVSVEVTTTAKLTGKILGVETKKKEVGEKVIEVEMLNLLTDDGLHSLRLDQASSIRLLDERLNKELQDALQVLATGLDNQRKPVVVNFSGTGERHVLVGYLTEAPLWKTSYRLVLDEKQNVFQGWAIVENTSDADWKNVHLELVSGRPISFIEDLYTPLYVSRPVYQPELFSSLGPVNYDANLLKDATFEENGSTMAAPAMSPMPKPAGGAGPAGLAGPRAELSDHFSNRAASLAFRNDDLRTSVASAAEAKNLGEAFSYAIKEPVNLPRQQSALLPIITGGIGAWKVSIYNPRIHAKFPLYGLRIKNTTGAHLMGGPLTIYDSSVYAGDAIFEDLQRGEERLVSYAVDLGVSCECKTEPAPQEILAFKLAKHFLVISRKYRQTTRYTFKVKDEKNRVFIVEHSYQNGWKLVAPEKADERTDSLYRFRILLNAKDGGSLAVVEERIVEEETGIANINAPALLGYIQTGKMSDKVKVALQHVLELQAALYDSQQQQAKREAEIRDISNEQGRLRQTMAQLDRTSDLYKRYTTKLDQQETRIETLQGEIKVLQVKMDTQRKELDDYIAGLDIG